MSRKQSVALWLGVWLLCVGRVCEAFAGPSTAPAKRPWELAAQGSADRLWYAVTTPAGAPAVDVHTFIRTREPQGKWESLADFSTRMKAMSPADGRLLVALEGGEWKRIAPGQVLSGARLAGNGEIECIAGDDQAVWAVGIETRTPATTHSSTQMTVTTAPSGVPRMMLLRLDTGGWRGVAAVPAPATRDNSSGLSLLLINHLPTLAYVEGGARVSVAQWHDGPDAAWVPLGILDAPWAIRKVSLLNLEGKLIAWVAGDSGPGTLYFQEASENWREKALSVNEANRMADVAMAAFRGELRLIAVSPEERFYEQRFDHKGDAAGPWRELEEPPGPEDFTLGGLLQWGALVVLVVITLATANHGGVVQVAVVNNVRLAIAPLPLRLAAGLIDLWPFYLAPYLTLGQVREGMKLSQLSGDNSIYWALGISLAVYFLHITICEWIWGRSFGKMFVGLRVVSMVGEKPSIGSTLLRNLIRLVEVPIAAPLAMIFLNPLRQRFGDFFAGTVVTMKMPREIAEENSEF